MIMEAPYEVDILLFLGEVSSKNNWGLFLSHVSASVFELAEHRVWYKTLEDLYLGWYKDMVKR